MKNTFKQNRMDIRKAFTLLLSLFLLSLHSCSRLYEDESLEEKDNITALLPWKGETDKFTISPQEGIRLNAPQEESGTAYITIPSTTVRNTRWEFGVCLTFNPSSYNYARFYLASSSEVLSGNLNGYFIQIGGAKDNVGLYRQDDGQPKLLASGRELMKGNNSPKLSIKVECDNNGYWTFWTRLDTEKEYTEEKRVKDTGLQSSVCAGIYCVYTKTRRQGFRFHHVQLTRDISSGNAPDGTDPPAEPSLPDYPKEVRNLLSFNEVMYDNATDGAEYIELYNPSASPVSVAALKFIRYVDTGFGSTTTKTSVVLQQADGNRQIQVPPYGYICLTKYAAKLVSKHKADGKTIVEIANFPKLTNEDSYIAIMTDEEESRLIDKCSYFESMHTSGNKRHQGISLEKLSPELSSSTRKNWRSSDDVTGGTPGAANSSLVTPLF